ICAATDHSASLVGIVDQLGDSPFGVVHRRLAPSFSIVVQWVIGRHGTASRNFLAMRRLLFFSADLILSFRAQHTLTKGKVAYEFDLPNELAPFNLIFQVSMLKKCIGDPTSIIPLEGLGVHENLSCEEVLVEILDRQVKKLRNNEIASVKILWRNHLVEGATWEAKADMKSRYPHLFPSTPIQA
ncbi:hypothetical protein MTR67_043406, partial [Solanum verrucosum]